MRKKIETQKDWGWGGEVKGHGKKSINKRIHCGREKKMHHKKHCLKRNREEKERTKRKGVGLGRIVKENDKEK